MAPATMAAASESVRTIIPLLPRWQEARIVAAFAPLRGEPDLRPLDWLGPRTVLFPRVDGEDLIFHRVESPNHLRPGAFDVLEPDPSSCTVIAAAADLIFVPGLAFTADGARLGRGRGYYDRLLASLPASVQRVGVCFPGQLLDTLPVEPHDQKVDVVLTAPV
ncbi:MAG: 5-formyltetrahydrofolate cyclo-ligase [Chthoniobacterales bacterium]